jgi:ribonucleoside-diphosphate reductase alpha chain
MGTFEPSGLGKEIFELRYARTPEESWAEACWRVADHVAAAESEDRLNDVRESFYELLSTNKFMPGGRIWYGSGRTKGQLLNCFVIPTEDSREGWGKSLSDVVIVSGMGGGVGLNCSPIRPRGSKIAGTGGEATGAVSLMRMIDSVGDELKGGGGRRLALMLALDIDHPDIEEFIHEKLDLHRLNNANVSVVIPRWINPDVFVDLVRNGASIPLRFAGRETGQTIDAGELWERIVKNALETGEPGVLNGYLANQENNIWYHKNLISTNPCGEIWLEPYGCCDLGALVLPRFVGEDGRVDWDSMAEGIYHSVRFLDNVLSVNVYPLREIGENCLSVRRIGLGVTGLASYLLERGIPYSDAASECDTLFSFIKETAYRASVALAREKGSFPAYSPEFLESNFVRRLDPSLRAEIEEHGIRNCALLTIAPTGTTSIVSGVTSGIEPVVAAAYERRYWNGGHLESELVISPEFERFGSLVEGAAELRPEHHFRVQAVVQRHIDNAVSKTINLPADFSDGELSRLWLEYLPLIKGSTFYRWGSRENEPIKPVQVAALSMRDGGGMRSIDCPSGVCEL